VLIELLKERLGLVEAVSFRGGKVDVVSADRLRQPSRHHGNQLCEMAEWK
jgi:hypothetical protein